MNYGCEKNIIAIMITRNIVVLSSVIVKGMPVKKICCLGTGQAGVPTCAIIAFKCPEIKVTVVDTNPEEIFLWNANEMSAPAFGPGLIELVKKCLRKNLFFTTNERDSIKEADIIFVAAKFKMKTYGEGKDNVVDMSLIEKAAISIAEFAETDKIVVEKSHIPARTSEFLTRILKNKCRPGVSFRVVSSPHFYDEGNPIHQLFFPNRILMGIDDTPQGLSAAKDLTSVYQRWVLPQKIMIFNNWTVELSQIMTCAFAAQKLVSIQALTSICEETGASSVEIVKIMDADSRIGCDSQSTCLSLGKAFEVILNLIYICECMNLYEVADYWREVLEMYQFHQERFIKRLTNIMWEIGPDGLRVAIFGFAYYKDTMITTGSATITVCSRLLDERAVVNIYDPYVPKSQVIQDLKSGGSEHSLEYLEKAISVFADPYRAVYKCQLLVICTNWPEFPNLDFERIFDDMTKPAYVIESGNILEHSQLLELGFRVYTIGKFIKNRLVEPQTKPINSKFTYKI